MRISEVCRAYAATARSLASTIALRLQESGIIWTPQSPCHIPQLQYPSDIPRRLEDDCRIQRIQDGTWDRLIQAGNQCLCTAWVKCEVSYTRCASEIAATTESPQFQGRDVYINVLAQGVVNQYQELYWKLSDEIVKLQNGIQQAAGLPFAAGEEGIRPVVSLATTLTDDNKRADTRRGRPCTFTEAQVIAMSKLFAIDRHLNTKHKEALGCRIGLTRTQITRWFANKRNRKTGTAMGLSVWRRSGISRLWKDSRCPKKGEVDMEQYISQVADEYDQDVAAGRCGGLIVVNDPVITPQQEMDLSTSFVTSYSIPLDTINEVVCTQNEDSLHQTEENLPNPYDVFPQDVDFTALLNSVVASQSQSNDNVNLHQMETSFGDGLPFNSAAWDTFLQDSMTSLYTPPDNNLTVSSLTVEEPQVIENFVESLSSYSSDISTISPADCINPQPVPTSPKGWNWLYSLGLGAFSPGETSSNTYDSTLASSPTEILGEKTQTGQGWGNDTLAPGPMTPPSFSPDSFLTSR